MVTVNGNVYPSNDQYAIRYIHLCTQEGMTIMKSYFLSETINHY